MFTTTAVLLLKYRWMIYSVQMLSWTYVDIYLQNFWRNLWPWLSAGSIFFGITEFLAHYWPRVKQWAENIPLRIRLPIELVCLTLVIFYAGLLTWQNEHANWVNEHAKRMAETNSVDHGRSGLILPIGDLHEAAPWLGMAKGEVISALSISIESHQNGFLLFMTPLDKILRLDANHKFKIYEDKNTVTDPQMFDDEQIRIRLGSTIGSSCRPPKGGNAELWEKYSEFRTIGCRNWSCVLKPSTVRYQEFDNGLVVIGFPKYQNQPEGQTYFIRTSQSQPTTGSWETKNSTVPIPPPVCPP